MSLIENRGLSPIVPYCRELFLNRGPRLLICCPLQEQSIAASTSNDGSAAFLLLGDHFSELRIIFDWFDHQDILSVQNHEFGTVQFLSAAD